MAIQCSVVAFATPKDLETLFATARSPRNGLTPDFTDTASAQGVFAPGNAKTKKAWKR